MKILFTGGGTAGSVMPLLSIYEALNKKKPNSEFLFIGTHERFPEEKLMRGYAIEFRTIYCGKLRRYFDLKNITDVFATFFGFWQSLCIIKKFKPDFVVGAGGYVSVPVVWVAWLLKVKILIHQQDVKPSLTNIILVRFASIITVALEKSLARFPSKKTTLKGNPVRGDLDQGSKQQGLKIFKLSTDKPVLLIVGGSTGAVGLNRVVNKALYQLTKICQIVHITGDKKHVKGINNENYQQHEFVGPAMAHLLKTADLIISRAGMSALTEYSVLKKPVILIPLPGTHQLHNAKYFQEKKAAIILKQGDITSEILFDEVSKILKDDILLNQLSKNIGTIMKSGAAENIADLIINKCSNGHSTEK